MARKTLYELINNNPEVHVNEVDIVTNPLKAWKDGVRFIPTLKSGDKILSGVFLNRNEIQAFLRKAGAQL